MPYAHIHGFSIIYMYTISKSPTPAETGPCSMDGRSWYTLHTSIRDAYIWNRSALDIHTIRASYLNKQEVGSSLLFVIRDPWIGSRIMTRLSFLILLATHFSQGSPHWWPWRKCINHRKRSCAPVWGHANPITSGATFSNVIREARKVVYENPQLTLFRSINVIPEIWMSEELLFN